MLYFSLVRLRTEFGLMIWAQNSTDKLVENVQYKFLKSIAFCLNLPISRESFSLVAILFIFSLVRSDVSYLTSYLFMIFLIIILIVLIYYVKLVFVFIIIRLEILVYFLYLFMEKNYVPIHFFPNIMYFNL